MDLVTDAVGMPKKSPAARRRVVEIVMRVSQHHRSLGVAVADPDVSARHPFEKAGEILGNARQEVAFHIAVADQVVRPPPRQLSERI